MEIGNVWLKKIHMYTRKENKQKKQPRVKRRKWRTQIQDGEKGPSRARPPIASSGHLPPYIDHEYENRYHAQPVERRERERLQDVMRQDDAVEEDSEPTAIPRRRYQRESVGQRGEAEKHRRVAQRVRIRLDAERAVEHRIETQEGARVHDGREDDGDRADAPRGDQRPQRDTLARSFDAIGHWMKGVRYR